MRTRLILSLVFAGCIGVLLGGCRTSRITPYAWKPTEEDPRLFIRVPEGTPGSIELPEEERLHRSAWATEVGEVESPDPRWACCPEEAEEWKRNEISLFLGYTGVRAGDGITVGLTYFHFFRHNFGVAVFGEGVFGEEIIPVVGAGIVFRPIDEASVMFAVGAEFEDEHGHTSEKKETKGLFRFGAGYKVGEVAGIRLVPAVYLDLVQDKDPVLLFGFEFGKEW